MMSMLDGFSSYNQIAVAENEQYKMTFITHWGTFAYNCMPFGLINVGATFQRAMDSSFKDFHDRIIVVYLDDLTVFSKVRKNYLQDIRVVLQRCREHRISLNPKNSVFCVTKGKLLGHIVSKEGVKIDPERVNAIQHLILPSNRTGVRSFFSQVNFLRRFVPEFVETTKYIINLLSERYPFKWSIEAKEAFGKIKSSVAKAPTLITPDFKKDFIIYCYASKHTMSGILLQVDGSGAEGPIAFMSIPLKKHELKYSLSEKQAFTVVKVVKQFWYYILHSPSVVFVPDSAVKSIPTQQEVALSKRETWVTKIQEYDLDIHPTKMIKG